MFYPTAVSGEGKKSFVMLAPARSGVRRREGSARISVSSVLPPSPGSPAGIGIAVQPVGHLGDELKLRTQLRFLLPEKVNSALVTH
jgi:hypothetical protein